MKDSEMDELIFLWKEYGKARDKDLTKDAQDLKRQIRKFILSLPKFDEKRLGHKKVDKKAEELSRISSEMVEIKKAEIHSETRSHTEYRG